MLQTGMGGGFRVNVFPSSLSASGSGLVTTASATASPSGGVAPYSYSWATDGGISANSPFRSTTSFSATPPDFETLSTDAICTVTDNIGQVGTGSLSVTIASVGPG